MMDFKDLCGSFCRTKNDASGEAQMRCRYQARVAGRINGTDIAISGSGTFDEAKGVVEGYYELELMPVDAHPLILNAVLITGYPSVCKESGSIANPFRQGDYSYIREVNFGSHGHLRYAAQCREIASENGIKALDSYFQIEGTVVVPELLSTEPLIEYWTPFKRGELDGSFEIRWLTSAGSFISARAVTTYTLPIGNPTPTMTMSRSIQLHNVLQQQRLNVYQESRLINATQ
jgi:hypothetical protein